MVEPWRSKPAIVRKTWVGPSTVVLFIVADIQNRGKPCTSPTWASFRDPAGCWADHEYFLALLALYLQLVQSQIFVGIKPLLPGY
jgi:hypothetical protein